MVLLPGFSYAQDKEIRYCGQVEAMQRLLHAHPHAQMEFNRASEYLENFTREFIESQERGGGDEVYIVPIVFHIIHDDGPENISDEQILDAVGILNRDFRKQNSDLSLVVDQFEAIAADVGIEFRLAGRDPDGQCTSGINRVKSVLTYSGDEDVKSLIYWPRDSYLNIWVCDQAAGAAGYANFPSSVSAPWQAGYDGIVIRSNYVGSIGTGSSSRSRALTHEVGHWLNLLHTWGWSNTPGLSGNCGDDDMVSDTPNTIGWTSCSLTGSSCGNSVDNVQNYMEYSYCSRMFTQGQASRMRAALNSAVAERYKLITNSNHIQTGVANPPLCYADFTIDRQTVCQGEQVQFTDLSYHAISNWTWDFGDGTIISGSDAVQFANPVHTYQSPGVYTVKMTVTNSSDSEEVLSDFPVTVIASGALTAPLSEGFEASWPALNWFVQNDNNDAAWEVTPATAYSGTKCLRLRNFSNSVEDNSDEFYSSVFDMSDHDAAYIRFRWAYANKLNETDDRLRISVSPDCGESWDLVRLLRGNSSLPTVNPTNSSFTPASDSDWGYEEILVDESYLLTENFRVRFQFIGKGGNNIYIDDINIDVDGSSVGMNESLSDMDVTVFPNPSSGDASLILRDVLEDELKMEVYDASGKLVLMRMMNGGKGSEWRISIPHQPAGIYHLNLIGLHSRWSGRVLFD